MLFVGALAHAQSRSLPGLPTSAEAATHPAVAFLYPEQVSVIANRPSEVVLHFRLAQGMHIQAHKPADDLLIPTVLTFPEASGLQVHSIHYPPGEELVAADKSRLLVYSGEFSIRVQIVAAPGNHLAEGTLRYQACETNICQPPRTLPVVFEVHAKE